MDQPISKTNAPPSRLAGLLRLTRWDEHVLFTITLTVLGVNMAVRASGQPFTPDVRLLAVLVANGLAVAFAFMLNDAEDAPDDARDPQRAARNPVASGTLRVQTARRAALVVGALALACYAVLPARAFLAGAATVALGGLYSWRAVRLKAYPLVDVLAHVLMLSALLFLAGYWTYTPDLGRAWLVALAVALVSAYGQLYNQVRDESTDRAAGLHNTARVLGGRMTRAAMFGSLVLAALLLAISALAGLWPRGLALVPLALSPLLWYFRPAHDMRGTPAVDVSGRLQWGFMLIASATVGVWLVANWLA